MARVAPSNRILRLALPGALFILPACGQIDDAPEPTTPSVAESGSTLTDYSPDDRYIVQFANARGRSAMRQSGGEVLLDLPTRNAAAARLSRASVEALRRNPNIASIEVDVRRYPLAETTPYGIVMVQADQVAAQPAGDRTSVCIIDSGISAGHEDFAGLPVDGTVDAGSGDWGIDLCGHGTHVAGTVAAVAGNGIGVVGVAPEAAALHIVKVFGGADCGWTYSSGLVAALDACQAAGAQVVSMSLGGSTKSRLEDQAFAAAERAGVLSIAAAGNDGNTRKSYPASYDSVVSVAAIDSDGLIADFSQQNDQVEIAAPGVGVLSTYPYANSVTVGGSSYVGEVIEGAPSGDVNGALVDGGLCDSVGAWGGQVVLCQRGDISFLDKVNNAEAGGAVGTVIYNNEPGGFFGTLGGASSSYPAISISQEDGQALVATGLGQNANIVSGLADGYSALNGTSMATPHVSGVAALLWAHFPNATNAEIRDAMNATAVDLGAAGRDNAFGYGLVQTAAAYDYLAGNGGPVDPTCEADGVCDPACAEGADPDCDAGPSCEADGVCDPACAEGADPDCSACLPAGSACGSNSECCSNNCHRRHGCR